MAQIRTIHSTALALALGSGLLCPAGAQQIYGQPPGYGAPSPQYPYQQPPPAYSPPAQYQAPPPRNDIELYSLPGAQEEMPASPAPPPPPAPSAPPARPYPVTGPEPLPKAQYQEYPSYPEDQAGPDWSPPGGLLQVQDYQGVRYVSGGVGEGERAELNALSHQFNLRLLFAMQGSGDYLADVRVNIVDSRGAVVLDATSNGPWFLAQLPPGAYTVEAGAIGQTQRQSARIGGASQSRLNFYWR